MRSTMIVAVFILVLVFLSSNVSKAAEEVVIPIAKADLLAVNDAAKAKDAERKAEGVGVVGRVWGYVKDGVIYMASSTKEAVVEHPYITVATVAGVILADKNNDWTGLWKESSKSSGISTTGNTTTLNDESIVVTTGNNSPVTIYSNRDSDNAK